MFCAYLNASYWKCTGWLVQFQEFISDLMSKLGKELHLLSLESQNTLVWEGPWRSEVQCPACSRANVKAGAGCLGLCSVKAWTSPRMEPPGSLWTPALLFHHLIMKFHLLLPRRQFVFLDLRSQPLILPLCTSETSLTLIFYNSSSGKWRLQLNPHCGQYGPGGMSPAPLLSQPALTTLAKPPQGSLQFLNDFPMSRSPQLRFQMQSHNYGPGWKREKLGTNVSRNSHRTWNLNEVRKAPSFQWCARHHCGVSTELLPFYRQGFFLPPSGTSEAPVPHLTVQRSSW